MEQKASKYCSYWSAYLVVDLNSSGHEARCRCFYLLNHFPLQPATHCTNYLTSLSFTLRLIGAHAVTMKRDLFTCDSRPTLLPAFQLISFVNWCRIQSISFMEKNRHKVSLLHFLEYTCHQTWHDKIFHEYSTLEYLTFSDIYLLNLIRLFHLLADKLTFNCIQ